MPLLPNGQWTLEKNNEATPKMPSIHSLMGKTHTVEVHPHIDHLYKLKSEIDASPTRDRGIGEIKKTHPALADSLPRDAKGRVTPEMLDKHIASLPKQKVHLKIVPYKMGMQQHRNGAQQYVVSAGFHPDTVQSFSPGEKGLWNHLKSKQHDLGGHENQIGWARIDPWIAHNKEEKSKTPTMVPNDGHWHVDEIQSDFGVPDRLKASIENYTHPAQIRHDIENSDIPTEHPELADLLDHEEFTRAVHGKTQKIVEERKKSQPPSSKDFMKKLAHGHDDPMHMIHSAVNQLGREHGIESVSLDLPKHQAHQSGLRPKDDSGWDINHLDDRVIDHINDNNVPEEDIKRYWNNSGVPLKAQHSNDIDFKSALGKLGDKGLEEFASLASKDPSSWLVEGSGTSDWDEVLGNNEYKDMQPETRQKLLDATPRERDALSRFMNDHREHVFHDLRSQIAGTENYASPKKSIDEQEYDLPVHQINTYDKRPKKLGFSTVDKGAILGDYPNDPYHQVQFSQLYKKLKLIQDFLKTHYND